jgi:hypothetical protein
MKLPSHLHVVAWFKCVELCLHSLTRLGGVALKSIEITGPLIFNIVHALLIS